MKPPKCDREEDFYGEPLWLNRNLIIIKIEDTNRYICLTPEEANRMLTYNQPGRDNPNLENLPAVEQEAIDNYRGVTDKQRNPNYWYYKIPTTGQWVDSTFRGLLANNTNSMILRQKKKRGIQENFILYRSHGVSGMHDYITKTYYVEEAKRCDFYEDYPDCNESNQLENELEIFRQRPAHILNNNNSNRIRNAASRVRRRLAHVFEGM